MSDETDSDTPPTAAPAAPDRRGMRRRKWIIVLAVLGLLVALPMIGYQLLPIALEPFNAQYLEHCAGCHGEDMLGTEIGPALVGRELPGGGTVDELRVSITEGAPTLGMPAWGGQLSADAISSIAILIGERRRDFDFIGLLEPGAVELPEAAIATDDYVLTVEPVADGLHPAVFSVAPMPDGSILVTEKSGGLWRIAPDGETRTRIEGIPALLGSAVGFGQLAVGNGWLLEVALHPQYEENGWVYLSHTDRVEGVLATSMNRLIRGRIVDDQWVDTHVVWATDEAFYTAAPDTAAAGRIAFDDTGHVYLSVGLKSLVPNGGVQDLAQPYGKIHRMRDDGAIPPDNPFLDTPGALPTTWTYGHRSPQGLEFDPVTGTLWGTEMGPRGGDEINVLERGNNYGWPLVSRGLEYDGTKIDYGPFFGIEFDENDLEPPLVDLTPAPAVSSFVVYDGEAFPAWKGDLIVGSLRARALYRFVFDGRRLAHRELLLRGLGRIRDVEVDHEGRILLLLESRAGSQIVRLAPEEDAAIVMRPVVAQRG
jgi:glucose/arabinose dehydrogenase